MSKFKYSKNIFSIFLDTLEIYYKNFFSFARVMLYPVFGQLVGMVLIFFLTYIYRVYILDNLSPDQLGSGLIFLLLALLLLVLPGFAIFISSFWEYMVAMVSLNTMTEEIMKKGEISNFKAHNAQVKLKSNEYIVLLLFITLMWSVLFLIPFSSFFLGVFVNSAVISLVFGLLLFITAILCWFVAVKISVAFQIFAFENISPIETIKKSWKVTGNNFWRISFFGAAFIFITAFLLPEIFTSLAQKYDVLSFLRVPFKSYMQLFAYNDIFAQILSDAKLTVDSLSDNLALSMISLSATLFLLPLGSSAFTLLYFDLSDKNSRQ